MTVDFKSLPDTARIWIYQSNRSFSPDELAEIKQKTKEFLEQWTAHGTALKAGFELKYKRFLVIGLDQPQTATGCSIDASVHFIQQLEKDYQVDLLDKLNVSYKQGEFIAYKALKDFKKMAKNKAGATLHGTWVESIQLTKGARLKLEVFQEPSTRKKG